MQLTELRHKKGWDYGKRIMYDAQKKGGILMLIPLRTRLSGLRWTFVPKSLRFGRQFMSYYNFLLASQHWSADQIDAYQFERVRLLIRHAYTYSPFYQKRFAQIGLQPDDLRSWEDFRRIPYLTRADIRAHSEEIRTDKKTGEAVIATQTGGTTGAPLRLVRSVSSDKFRMAVEWRTYAMGEVDPFRRKLFVFGQMAYDETQEPFYFDHRVNGGWIRSYLVDAARMRMLYDLWRDYRPALVTGHIEVIRAFIKFVRKEGLAPISTGAIFSIGEAQHLGDHELIREAFSCPLYDFYGLRENAASASDCQHHRMHINAEFTLVEFEKQGRFAADDEPADIIGTNLHNMAFPMIRYDTGDVGCRASRRCECDRQLPTMRLLGGRERDLIVTKNHLVTITHHVPTIVGVSDGIEEIQFYQPDRERLVIRIKKNEQFSLDDESKIIEAVRKLTFGELRLSLEYVDTIPRTPLGKFRFIISDVPQELGG
ncbi:MAG: hypothetical protein AAB305_01035 [Candidatus Zixiibacteriota bacterium]